jgi:hypothetical protein
MTLFNYRTSDLQALETEVGNNPIRIASHDMYFRRFTTWEALSKPNIITMNNIVDPARLISDIQTVMVTAMAAAGYKSDQPAKSFKALANNKWAKPLLHSSFDFKWTSNSAKRESAIMAMASIIESLYATTVRNTMLKTQANRLRHILCQPLQPFVTGQFFIKHEGITYIHFWDEIYTPLVAVVDPSRNVIISAAAQEKARSIKSIQDIITKVASSPAAHLTSARLADKRKVIPDEVNRALKALVSVRTLLKSIFK